MKRLAAALVFAFVSLISALASAHKPSDSYLTLVADGSVVHGRWDIAVRDLAYVLPLDANGDGKVTWGEVDAQRSAITNYARERLTLPCPIEMGSRSLADHSDGTYVALDFTARCNAPVKSLDVDYRLFFDVDPQHRGLLRLEGKTSRTHVFSASDHSAHFDLETSGAGRQLVRIVEEGVLHIWTGYDHVLFLLALLLPSVLRRNAAKEWQPVQNLRVALVDVLRIVTAFTLAHSITLSLAALGVVTLPSRLVESAIAASVVLAAVNNLYPVLREDRWVAAFLLGLMHGFGFSATLTDLDLPRSNLVMTLFGFNAGVEIGQLAIVAVFVPLAFAIRRTSTYRVGLLRLGSSGILALSAVWLVERAFEVRLLTLGN